MHASAVSDKSSQINVFIDKHQMVIPDVSIITDCQANCKLGRWLEMLSG